MILTDLTVVKTKEKTMVKSFEPRIRTHLNVWIRDPLDVPVPDLLVPNLQRLAPDAVQDGQKSGLECVLEHLRAWIFKELSTPVPLFGIYRSAGIYRTPIDPTGGKPTGRYRPRPFFHLL